MTLPAVPPVSSRPASPLVVELVVVIFRVVPAVPGCRLVPLAAPLALQRLPLLEVLVVHVVQVVHLEHVFRVILEMPLVVEVPPRPVLRLRFSRAWQRFAAKLGLGCFFNVMRLQVF